MATKVPTTTGAPVNTNPWERQRGAASAHAMRGLLAGVALFACVSGCLGFASASAGQGGPSRGLVLKGVTVVDTRTGALSVDRAVMIEGSRIRDVVPAGTLPARGETRELSLPGKFVVPGFLDLHSQVLQLPDPTSALQVMLATGITGYRQMGGSPELLAKRGASRLSPAPDLPELLAMPGAALSEKTEPTPQSAVGAVRLRKAQGADFIKVVDMGASAFFAALDESNRLGLPFAGHLPATVDAREAAVRGMEAVEHLGPRNSLLIACSSQEAELRASAANLPPIRADAAAESGTAEVRRIAPGNPVLLTSAAEFDMTRRMVETYSPDKCLHLAETLAKHRVWQTPTLIRIHAMNRADDPVYRDDAKLRYVPQETRKLWDELAAEFSRRVRPEWRAALAKRYELQQELVRLFENAGVPMLAGTDAAGQWVIPGFSLHQEFDLLAAAGLSPLTILQMATLNGARFLGRETVMGSVERDKVADLVVLDADPTVSVQNLHAIHAVVRGGIWYSGADLMKLKRSAEHP